jgi:hypothetical protein
MAQVINPEDLCTEKNADGHQCWRRKEHDGPHLVAVEKTRGKWEWETWR